MSTPLIILAAILAFFALVLIPFMMFKGGRDEQHAHGKQGKKPNRKIRKKR